MRPLERLPMKRTGSIGSRVPPAVTSTRRPSQGRRPRAAAASTAASSARGSGSRPRPVLAARGERALLGLDHRRCRARGASPGSPGWRRRAYIRSFIAGATSRGAVQARKEVVEHRVGDPGGELGDRVRRGGRDQVGVRVGGDLEMADRVVLGRGSPGKAPRIGSRSNSSVEHRRADDPLERGGADEALAPSGSSAPGRRARPWWPGGRARAPCRRRCRRSLRAGCGPSALLGSAPSDAALGRYSYLSLPAASSSSAIVR